MGLGGVFCLCFFCRPAPTSQLLSSRQLSTAFEPVCLPRSIPDLPPLSESGDRQIKAQACLYVVFFSFDLLAATNFVFSNGYKIWKEFTKLVADRKSFGRTRCRITRSGSYNLQNLNLSGGDFAGEKENRDRAEYFVSRSVRAL